MWVVNLLILLSLFFAFLSCSTSYAARGGFERFRAATMSKHCQRLFAEDPSKHTVFFDGDEVDQVVENLGRGISRLRDHAQKSLVEANVQLDAIASHQEKRSWLRSLFLSDQGEKTLQLGLKELVFQNERQLAELALASAAIEKLQNAFWTLHRAESERAQNKVVDPALNYDGLVAEWYFGKVLREIDQGISKMPSMLTSPVVVELYTRQSSRIPENEIFPAERWAEINDHIELLLERATRKEKPEEKGALDQFKDDPYRGGMQETKLNKIPTETNPLEPIFVEAAEAARFKLFREEANKRGLPTPNEKELLALNSIAQELGKSIPDVVERYALIRINSWRTGPFAVETPSYYSTAMLLTKLSFEFRISDKDILTGYSDMKNEVLRRSRLSLPELEVVSLVETALRHGVSYDQVADSFEKLSVRSRVLSGPMLSSSALAILTEVQFEYPSLQVADILGAYRDPAEIVKAWSGGKVAITDVAVAMLTQSMFKHMVSARSIAQDVWTLRDELAAKGIRMKTLIAEDIALLIEFSLEYKVPPKLLAQLVFQLYSLSEKPLKIEQALTAIAFSFNESTQDLPSDQNIGRMLRLPFIQFGPTYSLLKSYRLHINGVKLAGPFGRGNGLNLQEAEEYQEIGPTILWKR